jgi:hypothetical protein
MKLFDHYMLFVHQNQGEGILINNNMKNVDSEK